jgi:hypothetical protein
MDFRAIAICLDDFNEVDFIGSNAVGRAIAFMGEQYT